MFLVVQRVVIGADEGLNAYLHEHGERTDWAWELPSGVPVDDPGRLVREVVAMQGRGRVAAFFSTSPPPMARPLRTFAGASTPSPDCSRWRRVCPWS